MREQVTLTAAMFSLFLSLQWPLWFPQSLQAQAEPFYKGKTVRVIVYSSPGGLYDVWARLVAQYMKQYIPGEPTLIVQNMTGGGGKIAMNYLYKVAIPDGLTIGVVPREGYLSQLIGEEGVQYDWAKFTWIGSPEKDTDFIYIRADAPFKDIYQFIKAKKPPRCGATGVGTTGWVTVKILKELIGAEIHLVAGYPGGNEIDLAVMRGEVICRGMATSTHFMREPYLTWHKEGFDRHLVLFGKERDRQTPDTPTIYEVAEKVGVPKARVAIMDVIGFANNAVRPFVGPPDIPADRATVLREAFNETVTS